VRHIVVTLVAGFVVAVPVSGQSVLDRSPNLQGVWGLDIGHLTFVLSHRFEFLEDSDAIWSIPTLTLGLGLPLGAMVGLDLTTFSEVVPEKLTGNEVQWWVKRPVGLTPSTDAAAIVGYNTAARSIDGAVTARQLVGDRFQLFGEGRVFSDLFGSGSGGAAGAVGAAIGLTEYLSITGDVGRVLTEDTVPTAWSAAIALAIPASPHTFALQIANSGATTLQGASREKALGAAAVRYGFTFTIPFGGRSRWTRIFTGPPGPPAAAMAEGVHTRPIVEMAFRGGEVRIRAGETVEWINQDPVPHTVTAVDHAWDSGLLREGEVYRRTFEEVGTFAFYCIPHPEMRGTVVVGP
jgi:plastocyanin